MYNNGFTIIELITSISIILVLAIILIPNIIGIKRSANDAAVSSVANNIIQSMAAIEASDDILVTGCRVSSEMIEFSTASGISTVRTNAPKPIVAARCFSSASQYTVNIDYTGGSTNRFQLSASK